MTVAELEFYQSIPKYLKSIAESLKVLTELLGKDKENK